MGAGLPGSFAPRPPDTREQDRARREQQQRWDEIGRIREYILRTYGLPQFPGFPVDAERRLQDQWLSVAVSDYQKARAAAKGKDDIRFHPPRITGVDPVSFTAILRRQALPVPVNESDPFTIRCRRLTTTIHLVLNSAVVAWAQMPIMALAVLRTPEWVVMCPVKYLLPRHYRGIRVQCLSQDMLGGIQPMR